MQGAEFVKRWQKKCANRTTTINLLGTSANVHEGTLKKPPVAASTNGQDDSVRQLLYQSPFATAEAVPGGKQTHVYITVGFASIATRPQNRHCKRLQRVQQELHPRNQRKQRKSICSATRSRAPQIKYRYQRANTSSLRSQL